MKHMQVSIFFYWTNMDIEKTEAFLISNGLDCLLSWGYRKPVCKRYPRSTEYSSYASNVCSLECDDVPAFADIILTEYPIF